MKKTIILVSFLLLAVFIFRPVTYGDVWFHLKTGEWIAANRAVPMTDMFTYTAAGNTWVDSHWLFQLLLYGFYTIFGMNGLPILRLLVFVGAFLFLFKTGYNRDGYVISLVLLFMANEKLLVRPEMFTFLFIALYMYVLHRNVANNFLEKLEEVPGTCPRRS